MPHLDQQHGKRFAELGPREPQILKPSKSYTSGQRETPSPKDPSCQWTRAGHTVEIGKNFLGAVGKYALLAGKCREWVFLCILAIRRSRLESRKVTLKPLRSFLSWQNHAIQRGTWPSTLKLPILDVPSYNFDFSLFHQDCI